MDKYFVGVDSSQVVKMDYMFYFNKSIETLPAINTTSVMTMSYLCNSCDALKTVSLPNTNLVTTFQAAFQSCPNLTYLKLNTDKCKTLSTMCFQCYKLKTVDISSLDNPTSTTHTSNMCNACHVLTAFIVRSMTKIPTINSNTFINCSHIDGSVDSYNPDGLADGYIYVPKAYAEQLKTATNWSAWADQIRALEDYTVDGTTTGELDETKI